jgi:lipoprotein-anchoring transpeptidase ErfK/SrfK
MNESPTERPGIRRRRRAAPLAIVAAVVALAPIAVGQLLPTGSAAGAAPTVPGFIPVSQQASVTKPASRSLPRHSALVAIVHHATTMRRAPGGARLAQVPIRTAFGSPQTLWVVAQAPGWLGVISTLAGNNHIGWIPRPSSGLVTLSWELRVSLAKRQLTVIDGGKVVRRLRVAIGRPSAPTPTGRFAVTDRLETGDPAGPYGCCILALSARSPHAIQGWTGGDRIAIHSTPDSSSIGQPVSHGCIRVTIADGRWLMNHIPLGTPTLIRT